jgi:hypothetical protein
MCTQYFYTPVVDGMYYGMASGRRVFGRAAPDI